MWRELINQRRDANGTRRRRRRREAEKHPSACVSSGRLRSSRVSRQKDFLLRSPLKPRKKSGTSGPSCAQEGTTEACLGNCFGCSEPRGEARKSSRRFTRLNSELRARKWTEHFIMCWFSFFLSSFLLLLHNKKSSEVGRVLITTLAPSWLAWRHIWVCKGSTMKPIKSLICLTICRGQRPDWGHPSRKRRPSFPFQTGETREGNCRQLPPFIWPRTHFLLRGSWLVCLYSAWQIKRRTNKKSKTNKQTNCQTGSISGQICKILQTIISAVKYLPELESQNLSERSQSDKVSNVAPCALMCVLMHQIRDDNPTRWTLYYVSSTLSPSQNVTFS